LKALYIEKMRSFLPKTHNMLEIAELLEVPADIWEAVIELNPEYIIIRYPDAANGVPAQIYTEEKAVFHHQKAKLVVEWAKSNLKLKNL
jgi:HEPN domain-containing protein